MTGDSKEKQMLEFWEKVFMAPAIVDLSMLNDLEFAHVADDMKKITPRIVIDYDRKLLKVVSK